MKTSAMFAVGTILAASCAMGAPSIRDNDPSIGLPSPRVTGGMPLEQALAARRSVRSFAETALTRGEIGQLLWAAQGVTEPDSGRRTSPSAGALYPLELYAVAPDGVWRYRPDGHRLERWLAGDRREGVAAAALGADAAREAPLQIVITGVRARTAIKYGGRADRYVAIEVGHAAQNVLLEAVAQGLGAVPLGAFDDDELRAALSIGSEETPYYVLCVGHAAGP